MHAPFTDRPTDILSSWIAQEILSPQILSRESHPSGDPSPVLSLKSGPLPWENESMRPGEGRKLFYQVVLGTIDLDKAITALNRIYRGRHSAHAPSAIDRDGKEAIVAVALVDEKGRMANTSSLAISSFAWGLPKALSGQLHGLSSWIRVENILLKALGIRLHRTNASGDALPLTRTILDEAADDLIRSLGLSRELVTGNRFAVRTSVHEKAKGVPDPLLFPPSLIKDLGVIQKMFAEDRSTRNLRLYLGHQRPADRIDILHDVERLRSSLAPLLMPPARWPGAIDQPLVLLQQVAVNLAMCSLKEDGLLAVNGPPGTGKTTLLRDMMAAVIASRAEAMCAFMDPAEAFSPSGHRVPAGGAWLHLYRLDPRLKGFEILITSSNNKAVENISAELPAIHNMANPGRDIDYFRNLSDALLERRTWGLAAAILGNVANRERFRQRFWWDKDVGFSSYLANQLQVRETALRAWQQAKGHFMDCLRRSRAHLSGLQKMSELVASLPAMERSLRSARADLLLRETALRAARDCRAAADDAYLHSIFYCRQCENALLIMRARRPSLFSRVLMTRQALRWRMDHALVNKKRKAAGMARHTYLIGLKNKNTTVDDCHARVKAGRDRCFMIRSRIAKAEKEIAAVRDELGRHLIDDDFFRLPHRDRHLTSPWLTKEAQSLRDDVFKAAMQLHKAFIDAAAKPLRHNLGVLMRSMGGQPLPDADSRTLSGDLWSSLFLVVPCLSTTFASLYSMFGSLPPASLGWLFIDEAGQALPQAAAGAIMRTKRAVIVGDPMQIEPVTRLPETLTREFCRSLRVDPDKFNAPLCSVQTLADAASPYFTEFEGRSGRRSIGIPLLVHRRCEDPMFGISNAIAYEGLMVQARPVARSTIRDVLGASRWIDVSGSNENKWSPEEGEIVLDMLRRLLSAGVEPQLFIISPFAIVAEHLRYLVLQSGILHAWLNEEERRWVHEHIGTVHTVQGREIQAVIFVLGAPLASQASAREWAGRTPNLLNVAVTRATQAFYVVGDRTSWKAAGVFGELDDRLPR